MPTRRVGKRESSVGRPTSLLSHGSTSVYDRLVPGRVALLHGTSSSGKTTVARAVQALSQESWLRLGIDAFWTAIDERWLEHGPRASEGFLWRAGGGGGAGWRWEGGRA